MSADRVGPRIWVSSGAEPGRPVPLPEGPVTIGRDPSCEIMIDDTAVSSAHLRIDTRGPSVIATDLDSRNGTYVNGEALSGPRRLRSGDVVALGEHRLEVALAPQELGEPTEAATRKAPRLSAQEHETARALIAPYLAGEPAARPATRAEMAAQLHVSERTVQRRLDALAAKLEVEPSHERPRLVAAVLLERGLGR